MDVHGFDGSAQDLDVDEGENLGGAEGAQQQADLNVFGDEIAGIDSSVWDVDADLIWGAEEVLPAGEAGIGQDDDELSL